MISRVQSHHRSPSLVPTSDLPPLAAPTDPAPREGTRPSDILINRLHEVKRVTKSLAAYFEAIAASHATQSKAFLSLADGKTIQTPFPESSLFLPSPTPPGEGQQLGWAELLAQIRDTTRVGGVAEGELAQDVTELVVAPLKKLRIEIKAHISALDKEVNKLADLVVKERENSVTVLTALSKSIASFASTPLSLPATEDPFIVRQAAEIQLREQVQRENELLKVSLSWQEQTEVFEKGIWERVGLAWTAWETAQATFLASTQERATTLHEKVTSVPPEAEWNFFVSQNHLVPANTPARDPKQITFPNQVDPTTLPVKEGVLQRKKRFVRNWKEAFFVLTPAGYLHEYRSSTATLSAPHLSILLPSSTLGPPPEPGVSKGGRMKEAKFVITGRESEKGTFCSGVRGTLNVKHKELERVYRFKSWEEARGWWIECEKFTKQSISMHAKVLEDRQGPGPAAVQNIGMAPVAAEAVAEEGAKADVANGSKATEVDDGSSDEELEDGSSDEAFEEARTTQSSVPTAVPLIGATTTSPSKVAFAEEKPAYTPTEGVVSGPERDLKIKAGAANGAGTGGEVRLPGATGLSPRASTSKRKVEDTPAIVSAVASNPTSPSSIPPPAASSTSFAVPAPTPSATPAAPVVSALATTTVEPPPKHHSYVDTAASSMADSPASSKGSKKKGGRLSRMFGRK